MKSYDYEAVVFDGEIYCIECLPTNASKEECDPIFADSEWDNYPTCCECFHVHDYVSLIQPKNEFWCIQKMSRWSENPCPYDGPAIRNAGIKAKYYSNKDEALRDAKIITEYNSIGFSVVRAKKLHPDYSVE